MSKNNTKEPIFKPASKIQALMMERASDTQILVIGGAAGCVDRDTEFLSQEGWKKISEYNEGDQVFEVDPDTQDGRFVFPKSYIKKPVDFFYTIKTPRGLNQKISPEHKNVMWSPKGDKVILSAEELYGIHQSTDRGAKLAFKTTYNHPTGFDLALSEQEIRLQVALKADGHLINENTGNWCVRLKKERKIPRFRNLLIEVGVNYREHYEESTGFTIFRFYYKDVTKSFYDWMFCGRNTAQIIVDEMQYWDGYYEVTGNRLPSITTVSKKCADAIQYFFNVCGYRASLRSDNRKGKKYITGGKEYTRVNNCYQITPTTQTTLSMERKPKGKLKIEKDYSQDYKYCFEVNSGFFLIRRGGDIVITGNSGKTTIMNHLPLMVVDDPRTTVALYRETNPMLEDGFWPNGRELWENLPDWVPNEIRPRTIREQKKEIILNNGARIKYKQCADPKQAKKDAQGQETTLYLLDEATQLEWGFTEYLMSRLRSRSKHFSRMVMSCNPDPDHPLRSFIDWWISEDGYPIRERDGVIRYMFKFDGEIIWGSSKEELAEKTGVPEKDWDTKFLSVSFVSATIDDNPIMDQINPTYRAWLEGLNPTDKAQLLHGNWDARPQGANYWRREWVKEITTHDMPSDVIACRAYDLAATERSQVNKNPDPTASGKLYMDSNRNFYMAGEYHEDFYDDVLGVYGQFCKTSGDRDNHIIKQAHVDGDDCLIILPIDPGASGKSAFNSMSSRIISEGFICKSDPMPINKSKLTRFQGFATACEIGKVYILVDTFDKKTLEFIRKQLEAFNGERSTATRKDEFPDLFATAFNFLSVKSVTKAIPLPTFSNDTKLSQYRKSLR